MKKWMHAIKVWYFETKEWARTIVISVFIATFSMLLSFLLFVIMSVGLMLWERPYSESRESIIVQTWTERVAALPNPVRNIFATAQQNIKKACDDVGFDFAKFDRPILVGAEDYDFAVIYLTKEKVFPLRIAEFDFVNGDVSRTVFYAIKESDGFNGTNREQFLVGRDEKDSFFRWSLKD